MISFGILATSTIEPRCKLVVCVLQALLLYREILSSLFKCVLTCSYCKGYCRFVYRCKNFSFVIKAF